MFSVSIVLNLTIRLNVSCCLSVVARLTILISVPSSLPVGPSRFSVPSWLRLVAGWLSVPSLLSVEVSWFSVTRLLIVMASWLSVTHLLIVVLCWLSELATCARVIIGEELQSGSPAFGELKEWALESEFFAVRRTFISQAGAATVAERGSHATVHDAQQEAFGGFFFASSSIIEGVASAVQPFISAHVSDLSESVTIDLLVSPPPVHVLPTHSPQRFPSAYLFLTNRSVVLSPARRHPSPALKLVRQRRMSVPLLLKRAAKPFSISAPPPRLL